MIAIAPDVLALTPLVAAPEPTERERQVDLPALKARYGGRLPRLFAIRAAGLGSFVYVVAQIYGVEDAGGSSCIVMELVEGETLPSRILRGPIGFAEAIVTANTIE